MDTCDVLIVGGGPAGSSCAWLLRQAGLDVLVLDKRQFPRDKTCAGWITPQVVQTLQLDLDDYSRENVLQPILGFRTSILGYREARLTFEDPVSYGIRRCEFDHYLLRRSEARFRLGESVRSIERSGTGWVVNGEIEAPLLIGAGGHFCPVARMLRESARWEPPLVTAQEAEFLLTPELKPHLTIDPQVPELYFCEDLGGYGWCVGKGEFLNIGMGRVDSKDASTELARLQTYLKEQGKYSGEVPIRFHGHAYYLYDGPSPHVVDDGVMLIGDAAGLAYPQSGEGIRPAVESGIMAAQVVLDSGKNYARSQLDLYRRRIEERFGKKRGSSVNWRAWLPESLERAVVTRLVGNAWFARNVIVQRWFLHMQQPALRL